MPELKWYLAAENNDPRTNEYLTDVIGRQYSMESACGDVPCSDGKERNLWLCRDFGQARTAIAAIPQFNLRLEILMAIGDNKPALWQLWKRKVRRRRRDAQIQRKVRKGTAAVKAA